MILTIFIDSFLLFMWRKRLWAAAVLVLVVLISHLPMGDYPLSTDDFLWNSHIQGSHQLYEHGLSIENPDKTFWQKMQHGFLFYSDLNDSLLEQRAYGNMVWWGAEEGRLHPFRPLSSFLLWIDLQLFSFDQLSFQWLSRVYFIFFALSALVFYSRLVLFEQGLGPDALSRITFLSVFLLVFDLSVTQNLFWLSARNAYVCLMFAMLSLSIHMHARQVQKDSLLIFSTILFLLALLSAEAAISLFGYFFAFALFLDRAGIVRAILRLLPYLFVIVLWRVYYNLNGFGAVDNGLYIDPGNNFFGFLVRLVFGIPQIFTAVLSGVDGSIQGLALEYQVWTLIITSTFTIALCWFARKIIFESRLNMFVFVGAILATVPHTALTAVTSRSGTFAALGLFYLLVKAIEKIKHSDQSNWKVRLFQLIAILVLFYHLVLPAMFSSLLFAGGVKYADKGFGVYAGLDEVFRNEPEKQLVIVNHPKPDLLLYAPFEWDQNNKVIPDKIQALAPGLSGFTLIRVDERSLELVADSVFVLDQDSPMPLPENMVARFFHSAHLSRFGQSLINQASMRYEHGESIEGAGMEITILEMQQKWVKKIGIRFTDQTNMEDKVWRAFNWETSAYYELPCPEVGDIIHFSGPFIENDFM